jgi:hypothetical protein
MPALLYVYVDDTDRVFQRVYQRSVRCFHIE